jgi:hypothetical protein
MAQSYWFGIQGSERNPMDLSLHVGAALIGLSVILVFLRSVLQVAVVNRQRGDWLARRIGWLVYTTLARRALGRQSFQRCPT